MGNGYSEIKDPPVSFAFNVELDTGFVGKVCGIDGLSKEVEMIEYRDSTTPNMPHFRQGRRKAPRITFKRAYLNGSNANEFYEWIMQADTGTVEARDVTITVGQYPHRDFAGKNSWVLSRCKPVKWSASSFDGMTSSLIFETIELVCEEIRLNS